MGLMYLHIVCKRENKLGKTIVDSFGLCFLVYLSNFDPHLQVTTYNQALLETKHCCLSTKSTKASTFAHNQYSSSIKAQDSDYISQVL